MNTAVNFYELKTRLADLGYNAPEVADQLRSILSQGEFDSAIVHTRQGGVKFEIELERNSKGDFELLFNHAFTDNVSQIFGPDVSAGDVIGMLRRQTFDEPNLDGPLDDDHIYELNERMRQRLSLETAPNDELLLTTNTITMNTENLGYLEKNLLNLGFGEKMNEELQKHIKAEAPAFELKTTQEYDKKPVDYTLHFKRGDQNETYFFNKYEAATKDEKQTFYLNKGFGMTAKEAYNLLEGRAVHKQLETREGEKYMAWVELNKAEKTESGNYKLNTYGEKYNYDPNRGLKHLDIVNSDPEKLMRSLERGNRHQLTVNQQGKEVKIFIEANPKDHQINIYNNKGVPQKLEAYKKQEAKEEQGEKKSRRQGAKVHA